MLRCGCETRRWAQRKASRPPPLRCGFDDGQRGRQPMEVMVEVMMEVVMVMMEVVVEVMMVVVMAAAAF